MKKLFYSLLALAMTAMTFTSCEDVPAPYDDPNNNTGGNPTVIDPKGTGTQDDPYNVMAAINYAKNLEVGEESERDIFIKGIVVSIAENYTTQYGNARFFISDDGTARNQFLIYRALYLGNKKYTDGDILAEGDTVIICGKITNYSGTIETQQNKAFLYSLNGKSEGGTPGGTTGEPKGTGTLDDPYNPAGVLAYINTLGADVESEKDVYIKGKVANIQEQYGTTYGNATFTIVEEGAEGTSFTVFRALYLGNKKYTSGDLLKEGDEVIVCGKVVNYRGNTPETAQGKAFLYSLNGKSEGGGGGGGTTGEAKGTGTLADPFNSVAATQFCEKLGSGNESDKEYYVKGKVVSIAENYTTQYGNARFYISDDGTANGQFLIYRALYLGNKKYTDGDLLKEGDEVIICGILTNYNGTAETQQNKAYLYSLNGKTEGGGGGGTTGEAKGTGTLADPFNAVAANNYASALASGAKSDKDVYIKGKISRIANNGEFGTQYGNATFYISDDGTTNNEFYVFRTLYLGNKKYDNASDPNIKVGDEVIIYGKVMNYQGNTPETSANESYIYSLNGKTEGGGGSGEPPSGAGTYDSPLTVTQAISLGNADAAWVKGYIVGYVSGQVISSGATFSAEGAGNTNLLIAASASETDVSKCMPIQLSRDYRADFALDANPGLLGKQVIIAGQLTAYFGVPGLKSPTYIEANGKSVGNKVRYRKR